MFFLFNVLLHVLHVFFLFNAALHAFLFNAALHVFCLMLYYMLLLYDMLFFV